MISYTKEFLDDLTILKLKQLARYNRISLDYRMTKGAIIDKLLEEQEKVLSSEVKEEQKSVRVKRLEELNK